MPFTFSAAYSSRIVKKKKAKTPLLKFSSSPLGSRRNRSSQSSQLKYEKAEDDEDFFEDRLDEISLVHYLRTDLLLRDVPQRMRHIRAHMFDPLPGGGGMNSTRIAEILNFRKFLPPTVTLAHLHALVESPTAVEREIAELTLAGIIRKIVVPGRGIGASSIGDGVILSQDLRALLDDVDGLDQEVKDKFWQCLDNDHMTAKVQRKLLTDSECIALMRAGFLTSASPSLHASNAFLRHDSSSRGTITSLYNISKAPSGSVAAVGGDGAIHQAGNTGKSGVILRTNSQIEQMLPQHRPGPSCLSKDEQEFNLALPNTGPYLKLLSSARSHLISILLKTRYRELPIYLIRERWDGGIAGDNPAAKAKQFRGEFVGILPGRTRKWKQFSGLSFDWVLAECLGAGLVEVFETGSVGRAVRAL